MDDESRMSGSIDRPARGLPILPIIAAFILGGLVGGAITFLATRNEDAEVAKDPIESAEGLEGEYDISRTESTLKDAALAQEDYRVSSPSYAGDAADLIAEGFRPDPEAIFEVVEYSENRYCMEAQVGTAPQMYHDSDFGAPQIGSCP